MVNLHVMTLNLHKEIINLQNAHQDLLTETPDLLNVKVHDPLHLEEGHDPLLRDAMVLDLL